MDLEKRTLSKFYPVKKDKYDYLLNSHDVDVTNYRLMPNKFYDIGIKSPSTKNGERRYELSFARNAKDSKLPTAYFQGLIGESLVRITIMELLRREKESLNLNNFSMIKGLKNDLLTESDNYSLKYNSRYSIELFSNKDIDRVQGEYDGMISYTQGEKNGLIVLESKTGSAGMFNNPKKNQDFIRKKFSSSLKELFPGYDIDFLFMGVSQTTLNKPYINKVLKRKFSYLKDMFSEDNVGTIIFNFPISKRRIINMGLKMASFHQLGRSNMPEMNSEFKFVENENYIWFLKGKRISKILEKTSFNNWTEIYRFG